MRSVCQRVMWISAAAAMAGGCAKYQPMPLTSQAVQKNLQPPDEQSLKLAAGEIHHPILKPMTIDLSHGITPEQAAVLAVIVNPQLRGERDRRAIASAQVLAAGILPNPTLTASADFPHGADPADSVTQYGVGVDWEFTALISQDAKKRAAAFDAQSVDLDIAWQEWQIAEAAKIAAYDVIALQQQLEAAKQADDQLGKNRDLTKQAVDQHQKTLLDLSAAEAASEDAHAAVLGAEKDLQHQRLMLNRAIGLPADKQVDLHYDGELPSHLDPPASDDLYNGLAQRRMDLLALDKGYQSQDETFRAAILQQFPKVTLGPTISRDNSGVNMIGLGLSVELPIFDHNQAVIATEKATRQKLFDEYSQRVFDANADIAQAIDDIESIDKQVAFAEQELPNIEKLEQSYRTAFQQGNTDALSYFTVQATLAQKRIDLLKLKQQLVETWIALEIAAGRDMPVESAR